MRISGFPPSTGFLWTLAAASGWPSSAGAAAARRPLLNLAGAADLPTRGHVEIEGVRTSSLDDDALTELRRRRIGFVFQFLQLLPTLNAVENVELPLQLAGARRPRGRAAEMLEMVGIAALADRHPHQLSGGEMQRVAIARALVHGPGLLLADEPTGSLDDEAAASVIGLLRDMRERLGTSILHGDPQPGSRRRRRPPPHPFATAGSPPAPSRPADPNRTRHGHGAGRPPLPASSCAPWSGTGRGRSSPCPRSPSGSRSSWPWTSRAKPRWGRSRSSLESLQGSASYEITQVGGIPEAVYGDLARLEAPLAFSPRIEGFALVPGTGEEVPIFGVDLVGDTTLGETGSRPRPDVAELLDDPSVWVTASFGVSPGDILSVVAGDRRMDLVVQGVLDPSDAGAGGGRFLLVDIALAERLLARAGRLDRIYVHAPSGDGLDWTDRLVPHLPPAASVLPAGTRTDDNRRMLRAFRWNLRMMSYTTILVGAFLIYNTITAYVVRRRQQIGIARALGASRAMVRVAFLIEGAVFGAIGAVGPVSCSAGCSRSGRWRRSAGR